MFCGDRLYGSVCGGGRAVARYNPLMHRKLFALLACVSTLCAQSEKPISGFSADGAKQQQALESTFDSSLNRQDLQEWLKRLSAKPHHLGSPYGKEVAEF